MAEAPTTEERTSGQGETYSPVARALHWSTALLVVVTVPIGLAMHYRGAHLNLWDATTNTLYDTHKLIGFTILWLVVARLAYRLFHGAPADEPTLEPWQKLVSHTVHWAIYGLLLTVPLLGWFGVQLFPALNVFGLFSLPAFLSPDKALSKTVFDIHAYLAFALAGLVAMHIGAAVFHHFIRKDGVLIRMWPGLARLRK